MRRLHPAGPPLLQEPASKGAIMHEASRTANQMSTSMHTLGGALLNKVPARKQGLRMAKQWTSYHVIRGYGQTVDMI